MKIKKQRDDKPQSNLDALLAQLQFNGDLLGEAAMMQPDLFGKAATYRVECMAEMHSAKRNLDMVIADRATQLRADALDRGEKMTERLLDENLDQDKGVIKAKTQYQDALEREEMSKLLVDAFRQRRDAIRVMVDMSRGEELGGRAAQKISNDLMKKRFPKGH